MLAISSALVLRLRPMVGDARQGWALLAAMAILLVAGVGVVYCGRDLGNPILTALGVDPAARQHGRQGGALRPGHDRPCSPRSTTGLSYGAVNAMHDCFTPLGGLVPLFLIQLGEVLPGGVGSGLYGILVFAILAVFVAGLMVGRTPEYLGKKIEAREMKFAMLAVLILPLSSWASPPSPPCCRSALASLANAGPHGLSEILYAYSSAAGNNGSAFAGLNANTPWYNTTLGIAMLARPLRLCRAGAGDRRIAGGQDEARRPRPAPSRPHGRLFVGLLDRRDPDPRRPAVLPGAGARARSSSTS